MDGKDGEWGCFPNGGFTFSDDNGVDDGQDDTNYGDGDDTNDHNADNQPIKQ